MIEKIEDFTIVAPNSTPPAFPSEFEAVLKTSKAINEFMPVWELFVNTKFFVPIIQDGSGESATGFLFSIIAYPDNNSPSVMISEQLERLANMQTESAIYITGTELIKMLHAEVGVVINTNLPDENSIFVIPKGVVRWLKESIQESK